MSELTIAGPAPSKPLAEVFFGTPETRQSPACYGYTLTTLVTLTGWFLKDASPVSAASGFGYWLGIAGGLLMLVLLLYPARKRVRFLQFLGSTAGWFRAHMIIGIIGPVLVLFHANFSTGSVNSLVALTCMLLVAGSGIVGRHLYARIHKGMYGGKLNVRELDADLSRARDNNVGIATLLPRFSRKIRDHVAEIHGDAITGTMPISTSLTWILKKYLVWLDLYLTAHKELKLARMSSRAVAGSNDRLRKLTNGYIRRLVNLAARLATFTLYERLFALWHVLHFPIFLMMILSSAFHVLAVHMY